jgi:hypothetical protein
MQQKDTPGSSAAVFPGTRHARPKAEDASSQGVEPHADISAIWSSEETCPSAIARQSHEPLPPRRCSRHRQRTRAKYWGRVRNARPHQSHEPLPPRRWVSPEYLLPRRWVGPEWWNRRRSYHRLVHDHRMPWSHRALGVNDPYPARPPKAPSRRCCREITPSWADVAAAVPPVIAASRRRPA